MLDNSPNGYGAAYVRVGNGRVFCASYLSLATWNGFVMPSFTRAEAIRVLEYYGHAYTFTNDGWTIEYVDAEGYTVTSERTRDELYPIGSGSWMWEVVAPVSVEVVDAVSDVIMSNLDMDIVTGASMDIVETWLAEDAGEYARKMAQGILIDYPETIRAEVVTWELFETRYFRVLTELVKNS